ncbi:hypothetical protein P4O66_022460 [Electrophorus voltai]|uniref:SUZ domain-containing protein n=1 Tax=Electrophorus voltai TaxID=2609070 RepID=A0AAD8ZLY8_9TELE|nr:hypothetical protein P4O66_022460 [Electrophorus voltai]
MEDEEVVESWEEAADSGEMERGLEEKLRISQKERLSSGGSGRSPTKAAIVIQEDSLPAAPPPQIRILKRPTSNGSLGSSETQNRPSPRVKSLAQREAEYAEARRRILGSADDTPQERPNSDRICGLVLGGVCGDSIIGYVGSSLEEFVGPKEETSCCRPVITACEQPHTFRRHKIKQPCGSSASRSRWYTRLSPAQMGIKVWVERRANDPSPSITLQFLSLFKPIFSMWDI